MKNKKEITFGKLSIKLQDQLKNLYNGLDGLRGNVQYFEPYFCYWRSYEDGHTPKWNTNVAYRIKG